MKYLELCAGIGGMRAGLSEAGWRCSLAVDNDPDAIEVHRMAHGRATFADVADLRADSLPDVDVWIAGFPCQPFSSSGNRLGFGHGSGNVFEQIARLLDVRRPKVVVLENVEGLLTNKAGHTFATVLLRLAQLGYEADWAVLDAEWFGVPQTRRRLFILAAQAGTLRRTGVMQAGQSQLDFDSPDATVFAPLVNGLSATWAHRGAGNLARLEERLRPAIGKAHPSGPHPFGPLGRTSGQDFVTYDFSCTSAAIDDRILAAIVAPSLSKGHLIRSGRYWTVKGVATKLHVRAKPLSHCVGTSLGAAPLFAVPIESVRSTRERNAFLEHANWSREQDGVLVMRLSPERTVLLFGHHTESVHRAVATWQAGVTRKYKQVGNMVAPACAKAIASVVGAAICTSS